MTVYYQQSDLVFPQGLTAAQLGNELDKVFDALSADPRVFSVDIVAEGAMSGTIMIEVNVPDSQPAPTAALTADLFAVAAQAAPALTGTTVKNITGIKALAAA